MTIPESSIFGKPFFSPPLMGFQNIWLIVFPYDFIIVNSLEFLIHLNNFASRIHRPVPIHEMHQLTYLFGSLMPPQQNSSSSRCCEHKDPKYCVKNASHTGNRTSAISRNTTPEANALHEVINGSTHIIKFSFTNIINKYIEILFTS